MSSVERVQVLEADNDSAFSGSDTPAETETAKSEAPSGGSVTVLRRPLAERIASLELVHPIPAPAPPASRIPYVVTEAATLPDFSAVLAARLLPRLPPPSPPEPPLETAAEIPALEPAVAEQAAAEEQTAISASPAVAEAVAPAVEQPEAVVAESAGIESTAIDGPGDAPAIAEEAKTVATPVTEEPDPAARLVQLIREQRAVLEKLAETTARDAAEAADALNVAPPPVDTAKTESETGRGDLEAAAPAIEPPADDAQPEPPAPRTAEEIIRALAESEPSQPPPASASSHYDDPLDEAVFAPRQGTANVPPVSNPASAAVAKTTDEDDGAHRPPMMIERAQVERLTAAAGLTQQVRPPSAIPGFLAGVSLSIAVGVALYFGLHAG